VLSRVHWVRPELVVEVKFLTWTEDNLLRQVVYQGLRDDNLAREVDARCRTRKLDSKAKLSQKTGCSQPGHLL
jgi:ATP-dependent DNA ligase